MANIKVIVEVEVPENFKPCESNEQAYELGYEQGDCPFTYWNEENSCISCGYDLRDCPMRTMKLVK